STVPLSRITLISMTGSILLEQRLSGSDETATDLFLGNLTRGNYLVKVTNQKGQTEIRKIVKY
ncbi:MAG: T9SS type A sorting domain-containing protein, partial [Marinilabiliales bacterium]|nr:T9SS type A sorting domain-containing protein [Marinilabiliales bacterium]